MTSAWRKSTYSADTANCVEVAHPRQDAVCVRDSTDHHGPHLTFTTQDWRLFLTTLQNSDIDAMW